MRLFLLSLLCLSVAVPATAADIVVTTVRDLSAADGLCSLREAVEAANTDMAVDACPAGNGQDRILLPTFDAPFFLDTQLEIRSDIDLYGTGSPSNRSTIRSFTSTARHLSVRASTTGDDVELRIFHVDFEDGVETTGGSILVEAGQRLVVSQCRFIENVATALTGLGGGAVSVAGGGFASFFETEFVDNSTAANGGAVASAGTLLILERTTFTGNTAGLNGAIYSTATTSIINSTFYENQAKGAGGADLRGGLFHSIISSTFYQNSSTGSTPGEPGGLDCSEATNPCIVENSLISRNRKMGSISDDDSDVDGPFVSNGHNVLNRASAADGFTDPTDLLLVSDSLPPLEDEGGYVRTLALPDDHPGDGHGDCSSTATDARGYDRAATGCDTGAYEIDTSAGATILQARIFLEGAYLPVPALSTARNADLPLAQPFGYRGYAGTESVFAHRQSTVDWVMVRLLSPFGDSFVEVSRRAGLLQSSGVVSELDGYSPLEFPIAGPGGISSLYVEVIPRNHAPLNTGMFIEMNRTTNTMVDFTAGDFEDANSFVLLPTDKGVPFYRGSRAGDAAGNGLVDGLDALAIEAALTSSAPYSPSDLDYDGDVDLTDLLELWLPNNGR